MPLAGVSTLFGQWVGNVDSYESYHMTRRFSDVSCNLKALHPDTSIGALPTAVTRIKDPRWDDSIYISAVLSSEFG